MRLNFQMFSGLMDTKQVQTINDVTFELLSLAQPCDSMTKSPHLLFFCGYYLQQVQLHKEASAVCAGSFVPLWKQERMNIVMVLHTHQNQTDDLDLNAVAKDFISLNDYRRSLFGL